MRSSSLDLVESRWFLGHRLALSLLLFVIARRLGRIAEVLLAGEVLRETSQRQPFGGELLLRRFDRLMRARLGPALEILEVGERSAHALGKRRAIEDVGVEVGAAD